VGYAGTEITVTFFGQTKSAKAGADGKWTVKLDPVPANAKPEAISILGTNSRILKNVLVGEVWICSGQSNMQWPVRSAHNPDLEVMAADYPLIRLISLPNVRHPRASKGLQGPMGRMQSTDRP